MTIICPVCSWEREAPASPEDDVCMNCGTLAQPQSPSLPAEPVSTSTSRPPWEAGGGLALETRVLQDVARCVKCSARRFTEDLHCRFCNEAFEARESASPARAGSSRRKRLLILGALAALEAVLLFPTRPPAPPPAPTPEASCESNLQQLQGAFRKLQSGGARVPSGSGSEFWRELAALKPGSPVLCCPLARKGYRGPSKSWQELDDADAILADLDGDHAGGGWVLFKNGTLRRVARGSPLYQQVLAGTKD